MKLKTLHKKNQLPFRLISRRARQRPFSTAGALNGNLAFGGHIITRTVIRRLHHQGMRAPSLGVVLRGLPARERSVTFPVWRKRCISHTMMEWLTLKWSATLLWLKPPFCMPTACHLSGMVNFRRTIRRVADHFRVNHSIIVWLMQRFRQTGNVTDRSRAGRPRKATPREDRLISKRARQHR
jgi:hypothetical protein